VRWIEAEPLRRDGGSSAPADPRQQPAQAPAQSATRLPGGAQPHRVFLRESSGRLPAGFDSGLGEKPETGANPNAAAAARARHIEKQKTWLSTRMASGRNDGMYGAMASRERSARRASRKPAAPPSTPNIVLSVTSWRMTRPAEAPIARRTEISLLRALARVSSRSRLAQAITRSTPTDPNKTQSVSRMFRTLE
jgi:hypothetical protein